MRLKPLPLYCVSVLVALAGCSQPAEQAATSAPAATSTAPALGIKPFGTGDPNFKPDYSQVPPEVAKVFEHIDANVDQHAENLRRWIQQPSISNSGEGIPESAEMVKGFYEELGCQTARVYDVGITEYGTPGNPVVYAKCDEGAEKTVAIYWMYDTMPVTQTDNWVAPPFEARVVSGEQAAVPTASRVIIGRGANNSKGGQMAQLNALRSIKAVHGKLPVNVIWIAEGDEERMDIGLRKFMSEHSDLFAEADALYAGAPSEGCVYIELTTSGKSWGRGPVQSDIHGGQSRTVDSVAWRHMHMLASLTSEANSYGPLIDGFFENMEEPTAEEVARMKEQAKNMDLAEMARNTGVARYRWDDPYLVLKGGQFGTAFNLDGIWGGNMYAGGAGAILPNKITSKHNFRYVPRMMGLDIVKKVRAQLDKNGYTDVELKLIGDVPWSRGSAPDTDISVARRKAAEQLTAAGFTNPAPGTTAALESSEDSGPTMTGGYWPAYLFADGENGEKVGTVSIPMGQGGAGGFIGGGGGRSHSSNEYYTIEAIGRTGGMAHQEKGVVAAVFEYAKTTTVPPKPKTSAAK